jgi:hypothetical protein
MSDLGSTKQMNGYAAKFVRFVGPDMLVIELNGNETTVSREFWRSLPIQEPRKEEEARK